MTERTRQLLAANDEPGAYEFPAGFGYDSLQRRARTVADRIERELGEPIEFEGANHNQDASFSVALGLKKHFRETQSGVYRPCLRFSNFGSLTTLTWAELLPKETVAGIKRINADCGFSFVDAEELDAPYDGVMAGKFESWWVRYFDWL